jgi:16S rRNA (cytosine967-C5)-methyltransferase
MSGPRETAVRVLSGVLWGGGYSDTILDILLSRDKTLSVEDRALATEITYGALRNLGRVDYVLSHFSNRQAATLDRDVLNILRVALYQILFLEKVPPYAVVDEAVNLAAVFGKRSAGSFINGLLRNALRGIDAVDYPSERTDPEGFLTVCCSLPAWISRLFIDRFGSERAVVIGRRYIERAPVTLRTNNLRVTRDRLLEELTTRGYEAQKTDLSPLGVEVRGGGALFKADLYLGGVFSLQDEASQLACLALDAQPGMRILDVCAAPGVKGTLVAELMGDRGRIVSVEINRARSVLIAENARRLGIHVLSAVTADITRPPFTSDRTFDRVLVDPPCSGLGTIRRSPEIKWRLGPNDVASLVDGQRRILSAAAAFVRPGGALVYAVCTINPDEGAGIIGEFLGSRPDYHLEDLTPPAGAAYAGLIENGALLTSPDRFETDYARIPDGFYIARLKRK